MPPPLAAALTILLVAYLLRWELKKQPRPSSAVWIPTLWLLIIGSRQVSQWLGIGSAPTAQRLQEGHPIDQVVYGALMLAGLCVLANRSARVGEIVKNNVFIVLFILFEGVSFLWSDFPIVALRRWIKALGDPVMVLVLLSDPFPARATTAAISRCAYVLIPMSVLFCKYYQHLGRTIDSWGNSAYTGVTFDKNMLGYLLFTFGLFFVAAFISTFVQPRVQRAWLSSDRLISILLLLMIGWLLLIANSSTATVALTVGTVIMVALRSASVRRHFWPYTLVVVLLATVLNTWFSLQATVAEAAGRDASFTGRTGLWETVLQEPINPLIGVGYSTFWLGERLAKFWAMYPTSPPIQAHNGYIETYLNLGLVGLSLLVCVLAVGLRRIRRGIALSLSTQNDRMFATFALAYGVAFLFYNITEAAFGGTNFLFIVFLMVACGDPAGVFEKRSPGAETPIPRSVAFAKIRAVTEGRIINPRRPTPVRTPSRSAVARYQSALSTRSRRDPTSGNL